MQNASTWGRQGKVDKHEHTEYKEHLSQIRQVSVSAVPGAHHANGIAEGNIGNCTSNVNHPAWQNQIRLNLEAGHTIMNIF